MTDVRRLFRELATFVGAIVLAAGATGGILFLVLAGLGAITNETRTSFGISSDEAYPAGSAGAEVLALLREEPELFGLTAQTTDYWARAATAFHEAELACFVVDVGLNHEPPASYLLELEGSDGAWRLVGVGRWSDSAWLATGPYPGPDGCAIHNAKPQGSRTSLRAKG